MKIYQTSLLNKFSNLTHCYTTKSSGFSEIPFSSLNLAFHVGDDDELVRKNHILLSSELKYDVEKLVHMKQIHSIKVHKVKSCDNFNNPPMCDALITDKIGTPLMVMVADCSPILFYDEKKKVIAVAHAGREGVFKNIVQNVIESFQSNYGSNTEDILVTIGASIKECCYEVGDDIYREAQELNLEYGILKQDNRYYLDLSSILKNQLLYSGIKEKHIEISNECNCCKNKTYFSYRADGKTGRFCGLIILKN